MSDVFKPLTLTLDFERNQHVDGNQPHNNNNDNSKLNNRCAFKVHTINKTVKQKTKQKRDSKINDMSRHN